MCCLFNLAAFQTQVAAAQSDTDFELSAKLLQSAASIFAYLKANVMGALQQEPTPDMNPETLGALSSLMLAQAQEIFVIQAINDKAKEVDTAKLAAQCEDFYAKAAKQMNSGDTASVWDKDWPAKVATKQSKYRALAQYFQSQVCTAKIALGEKIARLQDAIEHFKAAQQKSGDFTVHQEYLEKAEKDLARAQKFNTIFHETVPKAPNLEAIEKVPLVKVSAIPERLCSKYNGK